MLTGCLFRARGAGVVAVSYKVPQFLLARGIKRYMPLAPAGHVVRIADQETYRRHYLAQLRQLDPSAVWDEVHALVGRGVEPILCCYESLTKPGEFCHRTMVAEWFRERLGQPVDEMPIPPPRQTELSL